eukprot:s2319_g2.t1
MLKPRSRAEKKVEPKNMRFPGWPVVSSSSSSPASKEDDDEGHSIAKFSAVLDSRRSSAAKSLARSSDASDLLEGEGEEEEIAQHRATRASWLMIWCHERCYKPERSELRAHLTDVAMSLNAGILCMKKAVKYETWMKRSNNRTHVLITDWREAKPCLNAMEESRPREWPETMIILCDLPKSHENAISWAAKQDVSKCKLHVLLESPNKEHFQEIKDLLQGCYESMSKKRPVLLPSTPGPLADQHETARGSSERHSKVTIASDADSDEIREAIRSGSILSL